MIRSECAEADAGPPGARSHRLSVLLLVPLLAAMALPACVARGFSGPEVIAGGENTVSISSGRFNKPDSFAASYCGKHGKEAVFKGRRPLSDKNVLDLYIYDCLAKAEALGQPSI